MEQKKWKKLCIKIPLSTTSKEKLKFCIKIPKDYVDRETAGDTHFGYEVKYVSYSYSSIIYVSSSIDRGSILNWKNRLSAGLSTFTKTHNLDTLSFKGKQQDKKYWREEIMGHVVVGYLNVKQDKKSYYDLALSSIELCD
ncbi:MAG: hypothetical protein AAGA64_03925 [Bacteroidota bacterium]